MKKIILTVLVLAYFTGFLEAQNQQWETYFDNQNVTALYMEDDTVWIGVDSFLVKMDRITNDTSVFEIQFSGSHDESPISARSILSDTEGLKWVLSSFPMSEVLTFDGANWDTIALPEVLWSGAVPDTCGKIWLGTIGGLFEYSDDHWKKHDITTTEWPHVAITALAINNNNDKWLGVQPGLGMTPIGLMEYNDTGIVSYDLPALNTLEKSIWSIATSNGTAWLGTDNGLMKFDGTVCTVYDTLNSAISSNRIFNICIEQDSIVWMATDTGLCRFDGEEWESFNTKNSGLPSNNINALAIDNLGLKWFATDKGLAAYNEEGIVNVWRQKKLAATSFLLYPNPSNDYIFVNVPNKALQSVIEIRDLQGKLIRHFNINSTEKQIDITGLSPGLYFLRLHSGKINNTIKFMKQ